MNRFNEEKIQLIEALNMGPNPSSPQEVAGATIDLFSVVYSKDLPGKEFANLNRISGYIGATVLLTSITPSSLLDRDSKLEIIENSAGFLDRIPGRDGKSYVLRTMRRAESSYFKEEAFGESVGVRGDIFDLYMTTRNRVPKKSPLHLIREKMDERLSSAISIDELDVFRGFIGQYNALYHSGDDRYAQADLRMRV